MHAMWLAHVVCIMVVIFEEVSGHSHRIVLEDCQSHLEPMHDGEHTDQSVAPAGKGWLRLVHTYHTSKEDSLEKGKNCWVDELGQVAKAPAQPP